jgi:hypothetical protein
VYTLEASATVALVVIAPDGSTSDPSTVESGSAPSVTYSAAVLVDQEGLWRFTFTATGAVTDSESGSFYVRPSPAADVYTTVPELKASLSIPPTDVADDDDLADAVSVASRAVSIDCRRIFHQITETRTLRPPRDGRLLRLGDYMDLVSLTTLKTGTQGDGTYPDTWDAADFQLLCQDMSPNINAGPEPRPYRFVSAVGSRVFPPTRAGLGRADLIQIVGVWGWPQVPDPIRRASRMMAAEVFKLRDAPLGAAGMGDLGIIRVRENPRYQRLIADYRLTPVPVA